MRLLRASLLLSCLLASSCVLAESLRVELILFRQAPTPTNASHPAPDDWAVGAQAPDEKAIARLEEIAATLVPPAGYQVLWHDSWFQETGDLVRLSDGALRYGHAPIEGTLLLHSGRFLRLDLDLWVNRFGRYDELIASEHLSHEGQVTLGKLTYLDHPSLGVLIQVSRP
ncbi:CsiV family protein [Stutzerimonas urumqiensis]|uniref:CsiV family protein n=1 Tax=Stutzerimonas urumqiensis TaxID=638269 RepID=UPI000EB0E23A|nr:CsiV family protein [Stutzerimonas urumqiensis]